MQTGFGVLVVAFDTTSLKKIQLIFYQWQRLTQMMGKFTLIVAIQRR
jgi:hypothetical protein